ncbi:MAG: NlpC/P60 family protein [Thermoleophilia bacterium]
MPIRSGRVTRRRAAIALIAAGIAGGVAVPTYVAAQPGSISSQQAEVDRLQGQLDAADREAERATEAYNGARYELEQTQNRIKQNTELIETAQKTLGKARARLAERLRNIYADPPPSLVQVVMDSGSITSAVDSVRLFERIGDQDGAVVEQIRGDLNRLAEARVQLVKDRAAAKVHLADAEAKRDEVLAILKRRQDLLNNAKGELRRLIAEKRAAERRAAELQRQRALAAQNVSSPTASPSAGTPQSAPTYAPTGGGGGNAAAVSIAMQYLGVPYVWGGASPSGFDCSGLASYVYAQLGKSVPHYTGAIWAAFPKVAPGDLQPGDLVFFHQDLGHMGIYIGGGQFIHAPHTGDVVKISSLAERGGDFVGAVRP